jgi:predicted nucleic acid-binding protein
VDQVFLDANVLFSAAYRPDSRLRRLWSLKGVRLLTSVQAVEEVRRNLGSRQQRRELGRLLEGVEIAPNPSRPVDLSIDLPEADRTVFLAAVEARATHFLTGDFRHFSAYYGKEILGVLVLPPAEFFRLRIPEEDG